MLLPKRKKEEIKKGNPCLWGLWPFRFPFAPHIYIYSQTSIYIVRSIFSQRLNIDWLSLYSLRIGYAVRIHHWSARHQHTLSSPFDSFAPRRQVQKALWKPKAVPSRVQADSSVLLSFYHPRTSFGTRSDFAKFLLENDSVGLRLILIWRSAFCVGVAFHDQDVKERSLRQSRPENIIVALHLLFSSHASRRTRLNNVSLSDPLQKYFIITTSSDVEEEFVAKQHLSSWHFRIRCWAVCLDGSDFLFSPLST